MKWWRVMAVAVTVAGVLMLVSSGLGTRFGVWHYRTGLTMLRYAAYVGLAALVLCIVAALLTRSQSYGRWVLMLSLIASAATFGVPYSLMRAARRVPPIHDITTDTADPPAFVAIVPLRATATNAAEYAGDSIAALQRSAYPDIQPRTLALSPLDAFDRAVIAAQAMGWEIVAGDSPSGRLEATATTTWFGFKDDVVVRIRAAGSGSIVDVRSVSRVGRSDVGANAARIRSYFAELTRSR